MGWYLTITEEMRAAGLSGNGLLLYALIHGYSQGEQGCYYGSLAHTAEVVGCTAETARYTLKSFVDAGLVERFEFMDGGQHRVAYRTTQKIWDTQKIWEGHPKNLGTTTQKIWDNNNSDKKVIINPVIDNARARGFVPPSVDDVRAYCEERRNGISAQQFVDYYTANGWMVGKSKMKDWRAAVRNWETRRRDNPAPQAPRPAERRYLSPEERTLRALAQLQARDGQLNTFAPDEQ